MSRIDDGAVSNNSGNETFQEVVAARLSRRGLIGGGIAGAAALPASGHCSTPSRRSPSPARPAPPETAAVAHSSGSPGFPSRRPTRSSCRPATPPGADLLGRPGVQRPGVPAGRQQHAPPTRPQQWGMHNDGVVYFPIARLARGPARPEQRVHRRRACCSPTASRTGRRRRPRSRRTPTASSIIARSGAVCGATSGRSCARRPSPAASPRQTPIDDRRPGRPAPIRA